MVIETTPTGAAATPTDAAMPSETDVRSALADVPDPELPVVSVVDLGIVDRVAVGGGRIEVDLLPTFIGCPALDLIHAAVADRLSRFGLPVEVAFTTRTAWTSDRISAAGLERLRAAGIASPADPADVRCPWCDSARVAMDSAFGPTQCRSLFYCRDCRQPFEALKPI
jgi:ring-1,2-phenylacetyl-CoA epoxidase subunit PaaD